MWQEPAALRDFATAYVRCGGQTRRKPSGRIVSLMDARDGLKQSGPSMIAKELAVADVSTQRIQAAVPRDVPHLEQRGAALCGRGEEAGAQAVPTEQRRVETDAPGIRLDDLRHG